MRLAQPDDYPQLERLRRARGYFPSVFFDEDQFCHHGLKLLSEVTPDRRLVVALQQDRVVGDLLLELNDEHGVTHQLQTLVLDFAVSSFDGLKALVNKSVKIAAAYDNEFLLTDLPAGDQRSQLWFYRCGFRGEQNRAALRFPPGHRGPSSPDYRLRQASSDDLPFILETHAAYTSAYVPGSRQVDLAEVEFRYQLTYLTLDLTTVFVLEEMATGQLVGYMVVQPGPPARGEPSFYLYDVAVSPRFSGRGLSRYLIGAAESIAGQRGGVLYGDGSLGTRTIASWHAQMGYVVDTIRFALDVKRM